VKEKTKPKISRREGIIKIRMEINEIENEHKIEKKNQWNQRLLLKIKYQQN
jgi:hypothetical protein